LILSSHVFDEEEGADAITCLCSQRETGHRVGGLPCASGASVIGGGLGEVLLQMSGEGANGRGQRLRGKIAVIERRLGRDALVGIVDEHLTQQLKSSKIEGFDVLTQPILGLEETTH